MAIWYYLVGYKEYRMIGILSVLGLVVAIVIIVVSIVMGKKATQAGAYKISDQVRMTGLAILAVSAISLAGSSVIVVDAGEIAVQVMFGAVMPDTVGEGFHLKSPFVNVVTYDIRVQQYTMSGGTADSVDARTKDNSHVTVDATVLWYIDGQKAFDIYRSTAKSNEMLIELIVRPTIRNALYDVAARYTLEKIMQDREAYGLEVVQKIGSTFSDKGLVVDAVLIRSITPPTEVDSAIKDKLRSQQALEAKTFELETARKNAEIKKVEAEGIAQAQDIIQKKLTPLYVQYEALKSYEKLAGSPNTTFVIMPTSPNGAGMPIILDARK